MTSNGSILCPSGRCQDGAILLGIVQEDGYVSIANEKIVIDKEFVQIAHCGRSPEKRFRFAENCVNVGCKQWAHGRCGVIDKVTEILSPKEEITAVPECPIRPECRWYKQCGSKACVVCPEVITDLKDEQ
jgi:hypothetical protein